MAQSFQITDADPAIRAMFPGQITMAEAVSAVVELDAKEGRIAAHTFQVLNIPSVYRSGAIFKAFNAPNRDDRPRRPVKNPLSVEAAAACGQHYVVLRFADQEVIVLANPWPYFEMCVTLALGDWPQHCGDDEASWGRAFHFLVAIAEQMPGHVVGYNETVGNSLDRLHVVMHRQPAGMLYPVQAIFEQRRFPTYAHLGPHNGYPTDVFRFDFNSIELNVRAATALMMRWCRLGGESVSANAAATVENHRPVLYVMLRHRALKPVELSTMPAFLEMLGVFVLSQEHFEKVRTGDCAYDHFWKILASLRPDLAMRLEAWRPENMN